jgi:hypothetical protein
MIESHLGSVTVGTEPAGPKSDALSEATAIFVGLWVPSILSLGAFIAPHRGGMSTTRERR